MGSTPDGSAFNTHGTHQSVMHCPGTNGLTPCHGTCPKAKVPKGNCSRFKTRQRDREPAVRKQHADVAPWEDLSSSISVEQAVDIRKKRVPRHEVLRLFGGGIGAGI